MHVVKTIDRAIQTDRKKIEIIIWLLSSLPPAPSPTAESGLWISPKATRALSRLWRTVQNFSHTDISHLLHRSFMTGIYDPSELLVVQPDFEQILVFNVMRGGGVGVLRHESSWKRWGWLPFASLRGANCSVWSYLIHKYQASPRISGRTGVKYESSAFIHYFHTHHKAPSKILHNHCFQFLLDNGYAKFCGGGGGG